MVQKIVPILLFRCSLIRSFQIRRPRLFSIKFVANIMRQRLISRLIKRFHTSRIRCRRILSGTLFSTTSSNIISTLNRIPMLRTNRQFRFHITFITRPVRIITKLTIVTFQCPLMFLPRAPRLLGRRSFIPFRSFPTQISTSNRLTPMPKFHHTFNLSLR